MGASFPEVRQGSRSSMNRIRDHVQAVLDVQKDDLRTNDGEQIARQR